jgi:hypothetical protein
MTEATTQEPTRQIVTNAAATTSRPGGPAPRDDERLPTAERTPVERAPWRIPTDPPPV